MALAGCSGGDEDADQARKAAQSFSLAIERITDDVDANTTAALTALNEVADTSRDLRSASALLDRRARAVRSAELGLGRLKAPAPAKSTTQDLGRMLGDLGRNLTSTATDLRAARRGLADRHDAAIAGARLVLADKSGVWTLSRALRSLVDASAT